MVAGKRRAQPSRPAGLPSWAWTALAVGAVLLLAWFTLQILLGGDTEAPPKSTPSAAPTTPTTSGSPSKSPSPSPTQKPSPTTPTPTTPADLPALSPDQPRGLVIDGLVDAGFDDAVGTSDGTLRPASGEELSRWADRGSPGSPGEDAVIVVGAADPSDSSTALSRLPEVRVGTKIELRTDQGVLTYTVGKTFDVKSSGLLVNPEVTNRKPGRLLLVGEEYAASGDRLDTFQVVVAILTGAEPA